MSKKNERMTANIACAHHQLTHARLTYLSAYLYTYGYVLYVRVCVVLCVRHAYVHTHYHLTYMRGLSMPEKGFLRKALRKAL